MKNKYTKKITTLALVAAMSVEVLAMPASAATLGSTNTKQGWKSVVMLPSAGISYALSAKKTSLRDVENKLVRTGKMNKIKSAKSAKVDAATSSIAGEATVASNSDGVSLGAAQAYQDEVNAILDTTLTPVQIREKAVVQRAQLQKQADVVNTEEVSETEAIAASARAMTITDAELNSPIVRSDEQTQAEETTETAATAATEETPAEASTESTEAASESASEAATEASSESAGEAASETKSESKLVVSSASNYVNIRKEPNTDADVVGKLYADAVGTILEDTGDGWVKIQSGSVTGYVNKDYLMTGSAAEQKAAEVGQDQAVITTTTLRVRAAASVDSDVISLIGQGSKLDIIGEEGNFYKVSTDDGDGYVSKDYADVETIYPDAVSIEEEQAEQKAKEEKEKEKSASSSSSGSSSSSSSSSQSAEGASKGQQVVNYAMQFIGNPYVWGGSSLTNGTDCSGFTMAVYAHFGVSLPHYDGAQRSCGTAVNSLAEAKPGDLICYYGHVGIYMGNGQIVHASNPRTGITTGTATYRQIAAIRRIFN